MSESETGEAPRAAEDERFMRRAMELGRRGWARVHPNPLVGCVLVRDGRTVGEGWHAEFGGAHAEVAAIQAAGEDASGSTAYVSLEPCRHHGKTPPCTVALREAGVRRVVFGAADPGDRSGGGAAELRSERVQVTGPTLSLAQARWENPFFFHDDASRPWLALKLATSLDGKIAARPGVQTRISGPHALEATHRLRAGFDAILVGTRTAVVDDPRLTVRGSIRPRVPPSRVILDAGGRMDPSATIFGEEEGTVRVITTGASDPDWRREIESRGAKLVEVAAGRDGRVDLVEALRALRAHGMESVLCEGGGRLGTGLLQAELVDRLYLLVAPRFIGGTGVPAFPSGEEKSGEEDSAHGGRTLPGAEWALGEDPRRMDDDVWMAYRPEPA